MQLTQKEIQAVKFILQDKNLEVIEIPSLRMKEVLEYLDIPNVITAYGTMKSASELTYNILIKYLFYSPKHHAAMGWDGTIQDELDGWLINKPVTHIYKNGSKYKIKVIKNHKIKQYNTYSQIVLSKKQMKQIVKMYKDDEAYIYDIGYGLYDNASLQENIDLINKTKNKTRTRPIVAKISNMYYSKGAIYGDVAIYDKMCSKLIEKGYEFKFLICTLQKEISHLNKHNRKKIKGLKVCTFVISFDPINIAEF